MTPIEMRKPTKIGSLAHGATIAIDFEDECGQSQRLQVPATILEALLPTFRQILKTAAEGGNLKSAPRAETINVQATNLGVLLTFGFQGADSQSVEVPRQRAAKLVEDLQEILRVN